MKEPTLAVVREATKTAGKAGTTKAQRVPHRNLGEGASAEAKRMAAAILEVLAGARTPTEAAQALGLSLPRYYLLEVRALQGILVACEPRRRGPERSAESALASLRRECDQLRRECTRQQALVRAAQRTIGLTPPTPNAARPQRDGKKRRRRRPVARALRAAERLKEAVPASMSAAGATSPAMDS